MNPAGGSTVTDRGLDTLVGGALALIGYAVWPTWERETLATSTDRLLSALASYTDVLLSAYVDPGAVDRATVNAAAIAARRARIAAQASLRRAVAEPPRAGADTDTASGVLAAARRIVIALHALRARRLALVASHLDPLVDSVDTLAHVISVGV